MPRPRAAAEVRAPSPEGPQLGIARLDGRPRAPCARAGARALSDPARLRGVARAGSAGPHGAGPGRGRIRGRRGGFLRRSALRGETRPQLGRASVNDLGLGRAAERSFQTTPARCGPLAEARSRSSQVTQANAGFAGGPRKRDDGPGPTSPRNKWKQSLGIERPARMLLGRQPFWRIPYFPQERVGMSVKRAGPATLVPSE